MRRGTFTGVKGNTVIDYVLGDEEIKGKVERLRIAERVDSDHHPIEVWIRGQEGEENGKEKENRSGRGV